MRAFGALLVGILCLTVSSSANAARPNVLIFLTDDQGHQDQSMPLMPHAERIFGDGGVQFVNGFVTTPQCCPSRASIFSGEYSHNTGITHNNGTGFNATDTWERKLDAHGYYTGLIGKYLNGVETVDAPHFDFRDPATSPHGDEIARFDPRVDDFFAHAEAHDKRPWALEVASYSPHAPWTMSPPNPLPVPRFDPPPSYQEANRTDKDPAVRAISHPDAQIRAAYRGQQMEVQEADRELHHVFRVMRADGEARDTIAFFLSDNAFAWGEHGLLGKGMPYPESVQVPFFVRWPGHLPRGTVKRRLAANIDIAPTIYDATGIRPHYPVDGRSLLTPASRRWLLLEGQTTVVRIPPWWAYQTKHREYIRWSNGFTEHYNLRRDPWQLHADDSDHPKLDRKLRRARRCAGSDCP
jgi:arylsulfatase A-like enzyme